MNSESKLEEEIANLKKLEEEITILKKLTEERIKLKKRKAELEEEKEILEKALKMTIPFYSSRYFSSYYNRNWSEEKIRKADKRMAVYCLTHAIEIRKNEDGTKSYPYSAWRDLGYV